MDFSRASNPFSSASSIIGSTSVADTVNNMFNSNGIYFGLILVVLICIGIAIALYYIISRRIFGFSKVISKDTETPIRCNEKRQFGFTFDKSNNGERRSYSFWIYIHDMNVGREMFKHVLSISDNKTPQYIGKSSPYIFIDKTNNRLYVRFAKLNSINNTTFNDITYTGLSDTQTFNTFMSTGIVIPYIPLQRWVHVAIVCNANSYKNYIYTYVDGDLVNMTSTGEFEKVSNLRTTAKDLRDLDLNVSGFLTIGGNPTDLVDGPGFSGLIAKVTTFNYELNQQDVYNNYYEGPIGGLLAKLGLANYGLRNPIYKIS